jgi:hypothetical protein
MPYFERKKLSPAILDMQEETIFFSRSPQAIRLWLAVREPPLQSLPEDSIRAVSAARIASPSW